MTQPQSSDFDVAAAIADTLAYRVVAVPVPADARLAGVRVLRIDFGFEVPLDAPAFDVLDDDERARAARFVRAEDGVRSAATRTVLRRLLAELLGIAPAAVRLINDAAGRPQLAPGLAARAPGLDFNVSHSGAHALVAWSGAGRVGVDIEWGRPGVDWSSLGEAVFAPADARRIAALPAAAREAAFYRVWAAKEALLKALGTGIAGGLTAFSVLAEDGRADRPVVRIVDPASPASGVAAFDAGWLDAPADYAACVAWQRA
ncbi:4'-phosphopantetheinyl transferase family protein [Burkholderia alba]|uniref:4'-phosphopantetheinyl transferase family protein n=1 Tax=Burkholderia alba TaxID=2683677 RepID=UPI002B052D47|nr:4'-phosphopantetheinyl transferase superfamily protein [Burkholderia alba]